MPCYKTEIKVLERIREDLEAYESSLVLQNMDID